ncbi:MAG: lamin tail domain-containing protein [Candidatus Moranbacteria bacterium]|nr:lamin tail domain-containing protein [Candidatus Moranbacteria bacterium]
MKKRKKYKSIINKRIFRSAKKIGSVFAVLFLAVVFASVSGTNSYFSDTAISGGNTMTAGYWIPELTMSVSPSSPDGDNGWYASTPCITLTSSISDVTIYWEFTHNSSSISGSYLYPGSCIPVPEGKWDFSAHAANNDNSSWVSNIVTGSFKVDTQCPVVEITNPDDGDTLSGTVEIRGTVTDANPHHYWLVIQNSGGSIVAGPGTVNDTNSFTNKKFFDWDTTGVNDGDYTIKLEARDEAGNKCPNLAPVPADPENPSDSVDWIDVKVNNSVTAKAGDVIINEVMWMGSFGHTADEWIELRNMTGHEIDIGQWEIENAKHTGNNKIQIPASESIAAHGYFLIANYPKTSSNTELNVDVDVVNDSISLYNSNNGNLILKDKDVNIIDQAKGTPHWPAGWHGILFQMSMERNNTPGDGLDSGSWHTCVDFHCNNTTYWDHEGVNFGTPGHANLSVNDPSSEEYDPEFMEKEYFDKKEEKESEMSDGSEADSEDADEAVGEESASGEEATEENNTDETAETTDEPAIVPEENGEDESGEAEDPAASAPEENAGTDEDADNIDSDNDGGGDTTSSDTKEEIKDSGDDEEESAEVKKDEDDEGDKAEDDEEKTDGKSSAIQQKDDDSDSDKKDEDDDKKKDGDKKDSQKDDDSKGDSKSDNDSAKDA